MLGFIDKYNPVDRYDDITEMVLKQYEQVKDSLIEVTDASADPSLSFSPGETEKQALYIYNGTDFGDLRDYTLEASPNGKGGGSSSAPFDSDFTVTLPSSRTFGKFANGSIVPAAGKTANEVILMAAIDYIKPTLSSFRITGQPTKVEVGTTLSGSKPFAWNYAAQSGTVPLVSIIDADTLDVLAADTANDGSESATINAITLNGQGASQSWNLKGTDTTGATQITSNTFKVTSYFNIYFGAVTTFPSGSDGAVNRLYALDRITELTDSNTFSMPTNTSALNYVVLVPPGKTITEINDTGNLNASVLADYSAPENITIKDADGTDRTYKMYKLILGQAYSSAASHTIKTN